MLNRIHVYSGYSNDTTVRIFTFCLGVVLLLFSALFFANNVKAEEIEVPIEIEGIFYMTSDELTRIYETELDYNNDSDMLRRATAYYWDKSRVAVDPYVVDVTKIKQNEAARLEIYEYLKEEKAAQDADYSLSELSGSELHSRLLDFSFGNSKPQVRNTLYQNDESVDISDLTIDYVALTMRESEIVLDMYIRTNNDSILTFSEFDNNGFSAEINNTIINDTGQFILNFNEEIYEKEKQTTLFSSKLPRWFTMSTYNEINIPEILGVEGYLIQNLKDEFVALGPGPGRESWEQVVNYNTDGYRMFYDVYNHYGEDEKQLMELLYRYRNQFPEELIITFEYGGEKVDYPLLRGKEVNSQTINRSQE